MTLWSSPHPKESTALSLGQVQQSSEVGKIKELADSSGSVMPSSATSFASDGSEDAGFEDGSMGDVDMGDEETDGIQIDCIQTLTELEPGDLRGTNEDSPLMSDCKTPIPLPPPPIHVGSGAFGGNQAYVNLQTTLPRIISIIEQPSSPMQPYWSSTNTNESAVHPSRAPGDVGLNNIGNTCFMNSGLQCLVHTSPLVEFFVGSNVFERTATSLVYQFNSLMNHVWFGDKGALSLHDFKLVLGNKYGQFKDCRQHDCQEFLAVLLDMLHEELKLRQKTAVADSSVAESFIEDTNNMASDSSYKPEKSCDDDGVTQSSESESKKSSSCKRLKLDNEGCDSGSEAAVIHSSDIKRKSPSKAENCDRFINQTSADSLEGNTSVANVENKSGDDSDEQSQNVCPVLKAQTYWNKYMKENDTVIASTFQGMFKSAVTCSECSFISETYEPFMYLSLPIPRVMEKQLSVTFISIKERTQMRVEITLHLMGTVANLIQEVMKNLGEYAWDNHSKYVAAEVFNYRVSRVLDEKLQLRNLSTNSRNIYVYELNDAFDDNGNEISVSGTPPSKLESEKKYAISQADTGEKKLKAATEWDHDVSKEPLPLGLDASTGASSMPTYASPLGAPVGGGVYDIASSSTAQGVTSSSGDICISPTDNDNFNTVQCNICLEDYPRYELKKHLGCSCILCKECLTKSVEHFQADGGQTHDGKFIKCAVCLQTVDSDKTFVSVNELSTPASSLELIILSILFRNEPGTDANNNSSWNSGLFGYPWLIRVPSYVNAAQLVEFVESINPAPEVNHRLLSVKSDGKSCGQCIFSTRCNGCEIPKEGMISLNSCNSILISYVDLPSEQINEMQPPDMILQNELSSMQYNRNDEPTIDIHDCLRTFSETEHLDEQNPWFCPKCQKNQRATKALSICKFPDYLIVYLKRFVFLDQSSNKLNNRLTFPINDLDVSDYVTEGFGTNVGKYNLYSCVCHFGSASAGHYTAYAKNPVSSRWHYFNDSDIAERAPADNEYASAYVLFYEKQNLSCHIPSKCNRPLPELNSYDATSTIFTADTRGSYLPGEPVVSSGPGRVDDDFMNLQVDSTSPNFAYPHTSTEQDLMRLEVDEGVGTETSQLVEIHGGLGLSDNDLVVVTSSTSGAEDEERNFSDLGDGDSGISTSTHHHHELPSSSGGGADSTSN